MLPPLEELLGDLAEVYQRQGRTDDALEVMREAIEAGYRGQPDPQTTTDGPMDGVRSEALAPGVLAFAWFPEAEFVAALERWPELADRWGQDTFAGYRAATEQRLATAAAETGFPGVIIAPVEVSRFLEWCRAQGRDPASGEARAGYAADLARTDSGAVVSWPPGRNEACWCRSGRKYKKCCGSPAARAKS